VLARRRGQAGGADSTLPQGGALTAEEERRLARLIKPEDR
jgi:hypothetical protein